MSIVDLKYYTASSKSKEYKKCLLDISKLSKDNCWEAVLKAKRCLAREDKYKAYFYNTLKKLEALLGERKRVDFNIGEMRYTNIGVWGSKSVRIGKGEIHCSISKDNIYGIIRSEQNCFHHSSTADENISVFIDRVIKKGFADKFILWMEDEIKKLTEEN